MQRRGVWEGAGKEREARLLAEEEPLPPADSKGGKIPDDADGKQTCIPEVFGAEGGIFFSKKGVRAIMILKESGLAPLIRPASRPGVGKRDFPLSDLANRSRLDIFENGQLDRRSQSAH
jgi:hypothetical protein